MEEVRLAHDQFRALLAARFQATMHVTAKAAFIMADDLIQNDIKEDTFRDACHLAASNNAQRASEAEAEVRALRSQLAELQEKLMPWLGHYPGCAAKRWVIGRNQDPCTCGLDRLLKDGHV